MLIVVFIIHSCAFHHSHTKIKIYGHADMFGSCRVMFVAKTLSMNSCLDMLRPLCCRNETFQVKDDELLDFQSDESYIAGHE